MENKKTIIVIISTVLLSVAFFLGIILLIIFLDKREAINTKEELIECFNENYDLFVEVKEFVEKNNYAARITGDKRRRNEDKEFIIYYEDIGNQDVENQI